MIFYGGVNYTCWVLVLRFMLHRSSVFTLSFERMQHVCPCFMVLIHMQYSKQCITLLIIEELREQIDEIKYIKLTIINVIGLKSFTNII